MPQRRHYHLDEAPPTEPVQADWMLGGFLLLRRSMLDELGGFDEGFRLYGEDIDLQYRAMRAGWERWYVPAAVVRHEHKAETDKRWLTRRTLWHWRGHRALRAQAPRAAAGALASSAFGLKRVGDLRGELARRRPPGTVRRGAHRRATAPCAGMSHHASLARRRAAAVTTRCRRPGDGLAVVVDAQARDAEREARRRTVAAGARRDERDRRPSRGRRFRREADEPALRPASSRPA